MKNQKGNRVFEKRRVPVSFALKLRNFPKAIRIKLLISYLRAENPPNNAPLARPTAKPTVKPKSKLRNL